jgi:hypothetical protein
MAEDIDKRNLFPERKGGITLAEQVKIRTSIKSSKTNTGLTLYRLTPFA